MFEVPSTFALGLETRSRLFLVNRDFSVLMMNDCGSCDLRTMTAGVFVSSIQTLSPLFKSGRTDAR